MTTILPSRPEEARTVGNTPQPAPAAPRRTVIGRIARGARRLVLLPPALYMLAALVGLIPVNNGFEPAAGGVEVMVTSTVIHSDLVLPLRDEVIDWAQHLPPGDFAGDVGGARYVAFGWGNKEFFVNTPTPADMKVGTVLGALFWSPASCLHVHRWDDRGIPAGTRRTTISRDQYRRLVEYVLGSFRRDAGGRLSRVAGAGYGAYHALNTCNCWTGRGLRAAGVRVGWFTPLPRTVALYLPAERAE